MNVDELAQQARQDCISRAEAALNAEVAMVQARHQARLNPHEHLVTLETSKLMIEKAKTHFSEDDIDPGLELMAASEKLLNRLCWDMGR